MDVIALGPLVLPAQWYTLLSQPLPCRAVGSPPIPQWSPLQTGEAREILTPPKHHLLPLRFNMLSESQFAAASYCRSTSGDDLHVGLGGLYVRCRQTIYFGWCRRWLLPRWYGLFISIFFIFWEIVLVPWGGRGLRLFQMLSDSYSPIPNILILTHFRHLVNAL